LNLNRESKTPLFKQIQIQLQELIDNSVVEPGYRLPPTRSLAERLGVHRSTVCKAYEELWALGYLESRPGSYSTVRKKPKLATHTQKSDTKPFAWERVFTPKADTVYRWYAKSKSHTIQPGSSDAINFSTLDMDRRLFPVDDFRKCMNRVLAVDGENLLVYGECEGYRPLREYIAHRLRIHGISVSWEEILITHGAQNGFDLILKLMTTPGCRVLVESPTYSLVLPMLIYYQAETVGIPMQETGMNLRRLESELKKEKPAFVYTIPNFHNPTGITTTQVHRERLLSLCEKYGVPLVEDAFEEEMKYFGKVALPVKSMDNSQIVLYLGTFSKVLFPGLRIGYIAANRECIRRLTAIKRYSDLSTSNMIQAALAEFCRKGSYDIHIKRMHRIFRKRMQKALDALKAHITHKKVAWTEPSGGYLVWLLLKDVHTDEENLHRIFLENGVLTAPGDVFFPNGEKDKYCRLSISTLNEEEIEEGAKRLGKAIEHIYR
jgi:DNA-binding transcriptional MocR family regulator